MAVPDATIKQQILDYLGDKSKEKDFDISDLTLDGIKDHVKVSEKRLKRCLDELQDNENQIETQNVEMEIYKLPGHNLEKHKKFFKDTASNLFIGLIITSVIIYNFPGVINVIKTQTKTEIDFFVSYMWASFISVLFFAWLFRKSYSWVLSQVSIFTKINKKALSTIFVTIFITTIIFVILSVVLTKYIFEWELTPTIILTAIGFGITAGTFVWKHVVKDYM